MPTDAGSGTQNAVLDTEHTLATITAEGSYVFVVDTDEMTNGDVLELRIYTKVLSGGASGLAYEAHYAHVQAQPIKYSVPVPVDIEFKATLTQTDGTARSFPWKILAL